MKKLNLQGMKFGRLLVVSEHGRSKDSRVLWKCMCDCGKETIVQASHLKSGRIKSCGCLRNETSKKVNITHGKSKTPEYKTWCGMIKRCQNRNCTGYSDYGGRGIAVCERWLKFENFLEDMGMRPSKYHSIERKNVNGNYEPDNCKWASPTEQSRNTRKRKDGENLVVGVSWHKATKKYMAYITVNGKSIYLGVFPSIEEATKARKAAELKYWGKFPEEKLCTE